MNKKELQLLKQKLRENVPGFLSIISEEYGCTPSFLHQYFRGEKNCKKYPTISDIAFRLLREREENDRTNREYLAKITNTTC